MATFAVYTLVPLAPLHIGSRRVGMVAETHRHVPGHVITHALAATVGASRGTRPEVFAGALEEITRRFRFGPAFFVRCGSPMDEAEVERDLLSSSHHVTLDGTARSAVDGALFEVECLHATPDIRLSGGVWCTDSEEIDGRALREWFNDVRLGGELKAGFGRVHCNDWQSGAKHYPGIGPANSTGVQLAAGDRLPGAALSGTEAAPLRPWLGRRHDPTQGFGRRLSQAAMVRFNSRASDDALFLPSSVEPGLGCWAVVET